MTISEIADLELKTAKFLEIEEDTKKKKKKTDEEEEDDDNDKFAEEDDDDEKDDFDSESGAGFDGDK